MESYSSASPHRMSKLGAALSALDSNLKRLICVGFVEAIAVSLFASVLMPYYRSLGFGSATAGVLASVLQVVSAVVAIFAGLLADTLGRKKLYVAGQVLRCLAVGLLLVTRNFAGLVLISAVRGAASMQSPAQSAMLASYTRRENRSTLLGLSQTLFQLASVLGPLAAGVIADRYGVMTSFGAGLILACAAVALAIPLKERPAEAAPLSRPKSEGAAPREALTFRIRRMFKENRTEALVSLLAASLTNGLANGAINILLPFTIMDRFSSAYTIMSASQSTAAFGTMLVLLIGGRIADVYGRRGVVLISGVVFPILMLAILLSESLWQLFALIILLTMVGSISSPAINAVCMEAVADGDRATFAGFQMSLNNIGMAAGSIAAGISYRLSTSWSWVAVIILFALQTPLYAVAIPKRKTG